MPLINNKLKKSENILLFEEPTDEQCLENLDRYIQALYIKKQAFLNESPYARITINEAERIERDYNQDIQNCERKRKMLFDRMSIKLPREVLYKSSWFITILCTILGILGTIFAALLREKN